MSLFGSIMDKIFHHGAASQTTPAMPAPTAPAQAPTAAGPEALRAAPAATPPATQASIAAAPVDVEAVLSQMAGGAGGGNWRTSIVDLLKLLDLDSSLAAREELGAELAVHAGPAGSAEQNIALHKAVMAKLAANGGKVPASLQN